MNGEENYTKIINEQNIRSSLPKTNRHSNIPLVTDEYILSEVGRKNREEFLSKTGSIPTEIDERKLLKPIQADMMKRIRGTAKWSQLHKTGQSIPAKVKILELVDNIEEELERNQTGIKGTEETEKVRQ